MEHTILKYFTNLSEIQLNQFEQLGTLYPEWNSKINVISRKDIDNLYPNHILHSLAIAKFLDGYKGPADGSSFLDMGTGGGFTGIPLAIMYPSCKFHLFDRLCKKLKVAQDIAEKIGLKNVTFQHGDIAECKGKYDFVVSRAVMELNDLLKLVSRNVAPKNINRIPNGVICLKGGDLNEEIAKSHKSVIDLDITDYFNEPFFDTKKIVYVPIVV